MPTAAPSTIRKSGLGAVTTIVVIAIIVIFAMVTNGSPSIKGDVNDGPIMAVFTVNLKAPEFLERPDARGTIHYDAGASFGDHTISEADEIRRVPGKFHWSSAELSVQPEQKLVLQATIANAGKLSRRDLACRIDLSRNGHAYDARPIVSPSTSETSRSCKVTVVVPAP